MLWISAAAALGFSTDSSAVKRVASRSLALTNSPTLITATFTNTGNSGLQGFFYTDQVPSGLSVTPLSVNLNGLPVSNYHFESGQDGDVYTGCTPRRWVVETPTLFSEGNTVWPQYVLQIVYQVNSSKAGTYKLQQFTWAAREYGSANTVFGGSEAAEQLTLNYVNSTNSYGRPYWTLWWQSTGGALAAWTMTGGTCASSTYVSPSGVGTAWKLVAAMDFNGDLKEDLLFESTSGNLAVWYMDGSKRVANGSTSPGQVDPSWQVVATGDLNGDGQKDLVWQSTGGLVTAWLMQGTTCTQTVAITTTPMNKNWRIVGTGDFNGDKQTDLLWQTTEGYLAVWYMNGTRYSGYAYLSPSKVDPSWRIVGTADFNADGTTEILWQSSSGGIGYWLMNRATCKSSNLFSPSSIDTSWKIAAPR